MSQSSRQVIQSRVSRETRRTDRTDKTNNGRVFESLGDRGGLDYNQIVYKSYQYPTEIGFQDLVSKKNVLHELMREFDENKGDRVVFDPYKGQQYSKRLFLLENQIENLLRANMVLEKGVEGSAEHRVLDYGNFMSEKENQISQLERKITYYEKDFRKHDHRTRELEDQVSRLHSIILQKNKIIQNFDGRNSKNIPGGKEGSAYADRLAEQIEKLRRNNSISMGQLQGVVQAWILRLPENSNLRQKIKIAESRMFNERKYKDYVISKLTQVSSLYKSQINDLSSRYGNQGKISYDNKLLSALTIDDSQKDPLYESIFGAFIGSPDYDFYSRDSLATRTVEVPVQDSRTKSLIHSLTKEMSRLTKKYPALHKEIDPRLAELFSQEIMDLMQVDEFDRLVEIVKIQPEIVKVDNVYTYNSEKNRKVQFHLRVLIKALLEEMEKMKIKTGIAPEIDEGVIGMIRQEIMDFVEVDDILRVYRTVPKIVQVERVIEKVVEKIIEVPKYVTAQTRVEAPVEVRKIEVVQNTINVPVQHPVITPLIQQKLVQVSQIHHTVITQPEIHQHIIQTIVQRPKIYQVDKIVIRQNEVAKIVEVPGPEKIVQIPKIQVVQLIKEVIVQTRQQVEKIKQVQVIVEKIVQIIKEVPKIIEIERIVTKTIPVKQYIENERIINNVTERYEPVQLIVEKIVPIIKIEERIVQVPQIIEKIVTVIEYRTEIQKVQCIEQKPIFQTQLKIVERIKQVPVVQIRQVEKIIEKIIQVPVIHEKIRIQKEYIKEPVIETIEKVIHQGVDLQKPVILYQDRIVQVDKIINHCIEVPQIINIEREILVPYKKVVERIVSTPTIVEKIIQKIVQVPRVVEVERIVQKIITVPRIVEKIVEVQKIVEKIVIQVVFEEKIIEKQFRVQVPVFQERLIEIEKPVNYYQRIQVPKQVREQILVKDTITHTVPQIRQIIQPPRIVVEIHEVDVPMVIEKIITLISTDNKYVELRQVEIVPVQIQLPVDIIRQKIVAIEHIKTEVQVQKAIMQKIVQVQVQPDPQVIQVDRFEEKIRIQKQYQVVENRIPYYNDRIVEVECIVQKIIQPIYYEVQRIVQVPTIIDKIVERIINVPKIYEIQRRNDVVVKDPIIIPIERIVPQLITLNKSFETIVDKIIQVPRLLEKLNVVNQTVERIVVQPTIQTRIQQVRTIEERQVIVEKIKEVQNKIHVVSQVLKTVEKIFEKQAEPIIIFQDRVMEVPFIVQKIVQKIVIMPQVVQILKYVHQIMDNDTLAVSNQVSVEDAQYTRLAKSVNLEVLKLKGILTESRSDSNQVRKQVTIIDNFLAEFQKFIVYPRIREIMSERKVESVVEKERLVRIPVSSSQDAQKNLASAVLIDKLVNQLRRFKKANPNMQWDLDEDILTIFGSQLEPISRSHGNDYNKVLDQYSRAVHSRFSSAGKWTPDHQIMLKSFIDQRFDLAYNYKRTASDNAKTKARYESVLQSYGKLKDENERMRTSYDSFNGIFSTIIEEGRRQNKIDQRTQNQFNEVYRGLTEIVAGYALHGAATHKLKPLDNQRFQSALRQKEEEIIILKQRIRELMMGKSRTSEHHYQRSTRTEDHSQCRDTIRTLQSRIRELQIQIQRLRIIESQHRGCQSTIDSLRSEINRIRLEISQTRSPKQSRGTKHSTTSPMQNQRHKDSSQGGLYGVNYLEYANLQDKGDSSDNLTSLNRIQRGVYRSGNYEGGSSNRVQSNTYNTQHYSTNYMSSSKNTMQQNNGRGGDLGTSSRRDSSGIQSNYRSGHKGGSSNQIIDRSRASNNSQNSTQMRQARYQVSEQDDSNLYGSSSSREVVKKTTTQMYEFKDGSSSARRFERSQYERHGQ